MATATIVIEEFERASICDCLGGNHRALRQERASFRRPLLFQKRFLDPVGVETIVKREMANNASFVIVVIAALACSYALTVLKAQEVNSPSSSASLERVRVALQQRQPSPVIVGPLVPIPPDEWRFGILTFLPPDTRGEFVRVRVPIGALVSGVAHSIAATQRHRDEKAAREDVAKALEEFRKAQTR